MTKQEEINEVLSIVEKIIANDTAYCYNCIYITSKSRDENLMRFETSIKEWLTDFPHYFVSYSKLSGRILFKTCMFQSECFIC